VSIILLESSVGDKRHQPLLFDIKLKSHGWIQSGADGGLLHSLALEKDASL
jgi:hypothetical protein